MCLAQIAPHRDCRPEVQLWSPDVTPSFGMPMIADDLFAACRVQRVVVPGGDGLPGAVRVTDDPVRVDDSERDASGATQANVPQAVAKQITGLSPSTTYHYRMVVLQGSYPCQTPSVGADVAFTTPAASTGGGGSSSLKYGKASLTSTKLKVSHGLSAASFKCTGARGALCLAKVTITARGRIGTKTKTVSCGGGTYAASAGHTRTVKGKLSSGCKTLLKNAKHHKLNATLVAKFTSKQSQLKKSVQLNG